MNIKKSVPITFLVSHNVTEFVVKLKMESKGKYRLYNPETHTNKDK